MVNQSECGMKKRIVEFDIFKGLLILSVVLGHTYWPYTEYIYWFHMPLFFVISGLFLKFDQSESFGHWAKRKTVKYMLPYVIAFVCEMVVFKNNALIELKYFLFGGRKLGGVYWFITCLFLCEGMLFWLERRIKVAKVKTAIIVFSFVMALIGSACLIQKYDSIEQITYCLSLPWNMDVCLFAVAFVAIGFYGKSYLKDVQSGIGQSNLTLAACCAALAVIVVLHQRGIITVKTDMKYSIYTIWSAPVALLIGYVLLRVSMMLAKIPIVSQLLAFIGQNSLIIMYAHLPVRDLIIKAVGESYSIAGCIVITVLISALISLMIKFVKKKIHTKS